MMLFVLLTGTALAGWLALTRGLPAIGRAKFEGRISRIRDDVMDAVIAGQMPLTDDVRRFVSYLDGMAENASEITFGSTLALHRAARKVGMPGLPPDPAYLDLPDGQRDLMRKREARAMRALADHLIEGSMLAFALRPMRWVFRRMVRHYGSAVDSSTVLVGPGKLAEEYRGREGINRKLMPA